MILDELSNLHWFMTNKGGNATNTSFPSRIPTTTPPSQVPATNGLSAVGDGVIAFGSPNGEYCPKDIVLLPYGVGSAANTFSINVYGWGSTSGSFGGTINTILWVPVLLATYTVTLGTAVGIAGSDLGATQLFATTITATYFPTGSPNNVPPVTEGWLTLSPGGNNIGCIFVRSLGFRFIEVTFNTNSSATSANCLYRKM